MVIVTGVGVLTLIVSGICMLVIVRSGIGGVCTFMSLFCWLLFSFVSVIVL